MVQVDRLSKSYGDRTLFSDASFQIGKRERCVVAGRNGSGKSTLLRIMTGIETADEGQIYVPKGLRIGALSQHLKFTQKTLLQEAVLGLRPEERDEEYRVEIILDGLGFSMDQLSLPPESFSGGYQLRLELCKVLAGEPDLLLLDEPTNYLDIVAIRWLESFLRNWHGQIIFISHDRSFVNSVCTHVIGIKRGQIKKIKGNLTAYEELIEIQEQTHEKRRDRLEKKKAHMMEFVEKFGAKATKATQAQSRLKAIEKMESLDALQDEEDLAFKFHYKRNQSKRFLHAQNLHFSYNERVPLIKGMNLEIDNGERIAIIGKNGSGKSTLLRLLGEDLKPNQGKITASPNTTVAYFGQTNIDRLNPEHTIKEELAATFPHASETQLYRTCGIMLFSGDDADKKISILSGGERSRVLLAKILLTPANLLLLDEPTHHLDVESVDALMHAIALFQGSTVLVTHNEDVLHQFNPHKIMICHEDRQQLFLGNYSIFLKEQGW